MDASADTVAAAPGDELGFAGPARLAALVRAGEVRPRELVEHALERIARADTELGAFRVLLAEQALAEADALEGAGDPDGTRPLLGVPVAIKDDLAVAGQVRTLGTDAHGGRREPADAEVVRLLRTAGAIPVGVTRVPELAAYGMTETATFGFTRNPWDRRRTPGGSSGGSAAAVAAGLVPLATASDAAGSIRIPASHCGLFGLKPQAGRLPAAPLPEIWNGLGVPGVLTRGVRDAAVAYEALTGEPWTAAAERPPGRLRVAVSFAPPPGWPAPLHGDHRRAVESTAQLLRDLGHDVREHELDVGRGAAGRTTLRYLVAAADDARALPHPERLERRTREIVRLGAALRPLLRRARELAAQDARRIDAIFASHDVVLTPTVAQPPPPLGTFEGLGGPRVLGAMLRRYPYCALWNHLGNPAAAVPAGFDRDGLPVSAQLVASPDGEPVLLSLARQLEEARPWTAHRPPPLP